MTWFQLPSGVTVLELDPFPGGLALELQVAVTAGIIYAAWLLDDGRVMRAWVAAEC